jgi:hypothetical protein
LTRQITTINPATEEVITTKEQIKEKTKKAQNAHLDWKKDIHKRADHIHDFERTGKSLQGKSHKKWERL